MLTVSIAIVTMGAEGIARVGAMVAPPKPGVRYTVSWQVSDGLVLPRVLQRGDVNVVRPAGKGSSANRNNAFLHSDGDIVVFLDDDVELFPAAIDELRESYVRHPECDLIMFRGKNGLKHYPSEGTPLNRRMPKGYYASGFEISVRRKGVMDAGLRFDPELGLGVPKFQAAEDEMYLLDAIALGLNCRFEPIDLCMHPHDSTGTKRNPPAGALRGMGVAIRAQYGVAEALLRLPLKVFRLWKHNACNPLLSAPLMLQGILHRRTPSRINSEREHPD